MNTLTETRRSPINLHALCALVACVIVLLSMAGCHAHKSELKQPQISAQFVAAYNAKDIAAMLALTHPKIKYMFIDNDQLALETAGHDALAKMLTSYFKSLPSSRSEIVNSAQDGPFIRQVEQAIWQDSQGQEKSQCALSVYEVKADLILNVWYFPAHSCD